MSTSICLDSEPVPVFDCALGEGAKGLNPPIVDWLSVRDR